MYNDPSAGPILGGGAGTAGARAATGFNVLAISALALTLIVVGLVLLRMKYVRLEPDRPGTRRTSAGEAGTWP